jgi:hypothetical protein
VRIKAAEAAKSFWREHHVDQDQRFSFRRGPGRTDPADADVGQRPTWRRRRPAGRQLRPDLLRTSASTAAASTPNAAPVSVGSRYSSIEYGRCIGDVGNNEGMLVCNGAQGVSRATTAAVATAAAMARATAAATTAGRPAASPRAATASAPKTAGSTPSARTPAGPQSRARSNTAAAGAISTTATACLRATARLGRFERDGRPGNGGGNNGGGWGGGNGPVNGTVETADPAAAGEAATPSPSMRTPTSAAVRRPSPARCPTSAVAS